ncbi:MAG TPA: type II toxin-antitoxin system HicB family antitoxin [Stellaceae bacterium]|jgi:antitoxin HicB|nr:type II toxin-antitoxin system HicB family antitoxin [Stellaceae bacterium]
MFDRLYAYPAHLERQPEGGFLVRFRDLPDALTEGIDRIAALAEGADCLSEALATRIAHNEDIPAASAAEHGEMLIAPEPTIALKAALCDALRAQGLKVADLARRLAVDYRQAARLLDPKYPSKLTGLEEALAVLGCQVAIAVDARPAA